MKLLASSLAVVCVLYAWSASVFADELSQPKAAAAGATDAPVWRVTNKCGVNSLYVMLRLHGRKVRYQDLDAMMPVGPKGCSLQDLRDNAAHFGLKTRMVKLTPEDLQSCGLPVLAHFEEEKAVTGHYVVIALVTSNGMEFIDGTTGIVRALPTYEFARSWTGYALIVEERPLWHLLFPAAFLLGVAAVGLAIYARRRKPTAGLPSVALP